MREVGLREAKATLSALVDKAGHGEPSIITRHGRPEAVIIGIEHWERLRRDPQFSGLPPSAPIEDGDLPERDMTSLSHAAFADWNAAEADEAFRHL